MRGHYDSYGCVFDENGDSYKWDMDWSDVCNLMFSNIPLNSSFISITLSPNLNLFRNIIILILLAYNP